MTPVSSRPTRGCHQAHPFLQSFGSRRDIGPALSTRRAQPRSGTVPGISAQREGGVTVAEPIIVVLGPWCGGTSAVAKVLHHLGILMGTKFDVGVRELDDTWEDTDLSLLCRRAFSEPDGQLLMDVQALRAKLRDWAVNHRRAARIAGRRPGVKHPALCSAVDHIRAAWGPLVP